MLLVANWTIQNDAKNLENDGSILSHGYTHLRVLSESYPMNTNMTGFKRFSFIFALESEVASALEGLRF